jgi:hypothetical protein
MNEGICDFRFAICDLGAAWRRTARQAHDSRRLGYVPALGLGRSHPIANRKSKIGNPMSELESVFYRVLGGPGRPAANILKRRNVDRSPGGFQSMSTPNRPCCEEQRRGSRGLYEQTRSVGHCGGVRGGGLGGQDSPENAGRLGGQRAECPQAGRDRAARIGLCLATSRVSLEVRIRDFREGVGVFPQLGFDFVTQCRQSRSRTRVADNALPGRIPVQLRQQCWQGRRQFPPFLRRERLDGLANLLYRAHKHRIRPRRRADKPGSPRSSSPPRKVRQPAFWRASEQSQIANLKSQILHDPKSLPHPT